MKSIKEIKEIIELVESFIAEECDWIEEVLFKNLSFRSVLKQYTKSMQNWFSFLKTLESAEEFELANRLWIIIDQEEKHMIYLTNLCTWVNEDAIKTIIDIKKELMYINCGL